MPAPGHAHRHILSRNYPYVWHRLLVVGAHLGRLLSYFGVIMALPALVGLFYREYGQAMAFSLAGLLTGLGGMALWHLLPRGRLGVREAILLCTGAWVLCSLIASVPLHLSIGAGYPNCLFESVSGLTTTGLTALRDLDLQPRTVLFWRSLSQLLGGLGILSFFLLVSYPGSMAHRLFQTEATKASVPRPVPSVRRTVMITWGLYGLLLSFNLLVLLLLRAGGFNAVNYAFTTTSTGGMSPHSLGLGYFRAAGHPYAAAIEAATVLFMVLSGLNYLLLFRALTGRLTVLFSGVEARRYWLLMLLAMTLVMVEMLITPATWLGLGAPGPEGQPGATVGLETFRLAGFQVASLVSTAGHITLPLESQLFGPAAKLLFLLLLIVGGCAGSTAGGLKILRAAVLNRSLLQEMRKLSHPQGATLPVVLDGTVVDRGIVAAMAAMGFGWLIMGMLGGILLALNSGHDALGCLSLSISALSNIGPSLLPMDLVAGLPLFSKLVLMVWMITGRLEILPVLAVISARTWHQ